MIAKLIVHGDTRAAALARLDAALAELHIVGLSRDQRQFPAPRGCHPAVCPSRSGHRLDRARARRAVVAKTQWAWPWPLCCCGGPHPGAERATATANPFSQRDGWRSGTGHTGRRLSSSTQARACPPSSPMAGTTP